MQGKLEITGPEMPAFTERLINLVPLPYALASILIAVIIGMPGQVFVVLLETRDLTLTFSLLRPAAEFFEALQFYLVQSVFMLTAFFSFYGTRYMRLKLVTAESELSSVTLQGEEAYHRAFRNVSRFFPPLLLAALLLPIGSTTLPSTSGYLVPLFILVAFVLFYFGVAGFIWVYFSSVWGLHKLGKETLRLKPFYEDSMLGLRAIGQLSLGLASAYFTMLGISGLSILLQFTALERSAPQLILLLLLLVLLGFSLFFLPLRDVHKKMIDVKREEQAAVRQRFAILLKAVHNPEAEEPETTITDLKNLQTLELLERKTASIGTWPFDTVILGKLLIIAMSSTATIIARMILIAAHL